jgi:dUTP pyrophosphatase
MAQSHYGKGKVELLHEETYKQLNLDTFILNSGSHKKVCVKCTRCGEQFLREFRFINQLHACPIRTVREDGVELKWCNHCKTWLCLNQFTKNAARKDGIASICEQCELTRPTAKRHNLNKENSRKTLAGWIKHRVSAKRAECKRNGTTFDIDNQYLVDRWEIQEGKCFYFGIPLKFGSSGPYAPTLERLDSNLGYIKGNVVFASKFANLGKSDSNISDAYEFISSIVQNISTEMPRIEVMLRHPDAKMPTRNRYTDAGLDIFSTVDVNISPREIVNIDPGIAFVAPVGYYITVEGRSSMYASGVVPFRGNVDTGYVGNITVSLMNVGNKMYHISKGDRIAQLVVHKLISADMSNVVNISSEYDIRGTNGFGSSGR